MLWVDPMKPQESLLGKRGGVRVREGDRKTEVGMSESERLEDAMLLAFQVEERATSQGMLAAHRSWKRQGNRFSPKASRSHCKD